MVQSEANDAEAVDPVALVAGGALLTSEDMARAGVTKTTLYRAVRSGRIEHPVRGVYCALSTLEETGARHAVLSLANPGGVVCLLSAARLHELGDEDPARVWVALRRSETKNPARDGPAFGARTVWWKDAQFETGIETRRILGVDVRLTDPARTVVDLIRYRKRLGDEPAMRALHDYVRGGGDVGEVWRRAEESGGIDAVEPFVRAADEFRGSMVGRGPA